MSLWIPLLSDASTSTGFVVWSIALLLVGFIVGLAVGWATRGKQVEQQQSAPLRSSRTKLPSKRSGFVTPETEKTKETSDGETTSPDEDTNPSNPQQPLTEFARQDGSGVRNDAQEEQVPAPESSVESGSVESVNSETDAAAGPEEAVERQEAKGESLAELLGGDGEVEVDEQLGTVFTKAPKRVDKLTQIKGVGPVLEQKLHKFGVYRFAQIAAWSEVNIETFSKKLGFVGRVQREEWVKQAKELEKN